MICTHPLFRLTSSSHHKVNSKLLIYCATTTCRVAFSLIIGAIAAACAPDCEEFPSGVFVKPLVRLVRHSKVNMQASAAWGLNRLIAHAPARGALAQVTLLFLLLIITVFQTFNACAGMLMKLHRSRNVGAAMRCRHSS